MKVTECSAGPRARDVGSDHRDRGAPRVVWDALCLQPCGSGVQVYAKELMASLSGIVDADKAALVRTDAQGLLPAGVLPVPRLPARGTRRILQGLRGPGRADLVHGLDASLPLRPRSRTVVTIHDLAVFDVPWAFDPRWVRGTRLTTARAIRTADALIAVSEFTAERVLEHFGRKATVTWEAAPGHLGPVAPGAVASVRQRYRLCERFVLYVGTVEPRKDLSTLARACKQADVELVVAGRVRHGCKAPSGARMLGYVRDEDLAGLYGAATLVGYPSVYEGFGLPPLEAMACGTPVVAYRVPAIAEVVREAAVLCAPHDVDEMTRSVRALLCDGDLRKTLVEAGLRRVNELTWQDTASRTAGVYRELGIDC
jgi:glycosyltransferase involved in cell wall biosynthesis